MNQFETLKLNKDFRRIYGRGKSLVHPTIVTYVTKNRLGSIRIGVTVGKKVGCAVKRNRARRVIMAAWRAVYPEIVVPCDIVFVARGRILLSKSGQVEVAMRNHLTELGILGIKE